MKQKTYTLFFEVDITYIGDNPWKRKDILAKNMQELLSNSTGAKVEVSCTEMQHGVIDDSASNLTQQFGEVEHK
jgi:hypothetical protein